MKVGSLVKRNQDTGTMKSYGKVNTHKRMTKQK